ncbi:MAG TPA: ribosome-associated translation inhibitor RaiA [Candidatus Paceibacterota bacterium]
MPITTNIKASNLTLTPSVADYVDKKLIRHIERFISRDDSSARADVELAKTSRHHNTSEEVFRAEINLHIGSMHLRAEAVNQDMFGAIDKLKDEILRELTSSKKKRFALFKYGAQQIKKILRRE